MHDAGAALARVAADMGAGEAQGLAQELHQEGARFDVAADGFSVHRHAHQGHSLSFSDRQVRPTCLKGPNAP
jgi:hypothetical protein